jgi:hypothetical protein
MSTAAEKATPTGGENTGIGQEGLDERQGFSPAPRK